MNLHRVKNNWKNIKDDLASFWGGLDCDLPILNKTQLVSYADKRNKLVSNTQVFSALPDVEKVALQLSDYQYYLSLGDRPSVAWLKTQGSRHRRSSD
jgi:hypothetical protein